MDDKTRSNRPPEEVRRDIEHTLSQMDATVDALAEKLSPEHLIDQAWGRLRGGADEGIGRVVREHPIPVALVGVGLGWLAVEEATDRGSAHGNGGDGAGAARVATLDVEERRERHAGGPEMVSRTTPWPESDRSLDRKLVRQDAERDREDDGPGLHERVGEAAASATSRAQAKASEAAERVRDLKDRATESASGAASEMKSRAREAGRRARHGFWDLLEENPLALGAVAFGVGLASGISVPSTRTEDRMMGRTSDSLEHEARRFGRETAEKAKRVAKDAAEAAAGETDRMVEAAAEAARRRAESEGLAPDALAREAKAARERTVEQAKEDPERLRTRRRPGENID